MNRTLALFISVVGHPLLILTYTLLLLLALNPQQFGSLSIADRHSVLLLISVFSTSFLLPGFGVALLKPLGFIKSLQMEDKQERTGAYIIAGVFYLWLFKNLHTGGQTPPLYQCFVLGATIGLFLAFFINIFTKISAHAVGMGGLLAMLLLTLRQPEWAKYGLQVGTTGASLQFSLIVVLAIALIFAGLVGTARLALGAHSPRDLYRGYAAGIVAVGLAAVIIAV
ncbi:MAG: hypothetical protein H6565_03720 [Lewinellaceae bacterium]|nr:hypothetical protein [Saprospiraceae bacterium]MCB0542631.1 hypothetical protein [Saprospiraceae bacterium]MCB9305685.1 hypothetical protein [Lewinellaceae bacterium]MCB9354071.1 hypothetical protein [Lewinellaceae bacterium]